MVAASYGRVVKSRRECASYSSRAEEFGDQNMTGICCGKRQRAKVVARFTVVWKSRKWCLLVATSRVSNSLLRRLKGSVLVYYCF